jgi:release factor glutamine methyltransferase
MTLREGITEASLAIARRDAETLLAHLLHQDRAWLIAHAGDPIQPADHESLRTLTARRAAGVPLQHLTGAQEFFGLSFRITPDVLIPRPETEHLVEAVIAWASTQPSQKLRILDVGTGSGAIALALAANLPAAEITAVDLSPAALFVAQANAKQLGLMHRVRFLRSDLLDALQPELAAGQRFDAWGLQRNRSQAWDAIVSNPPYVAQTDAPTLQPEVRDHEPHLALFAGDHGLAIYRRLIPQAHAALLPHGLLAMEIGFGQRDALTNLLSEPNHTWKDIRFLDDYAGIPRVVLATRL